MWFYSLPPFFVLFMLTSGTSVLRSCTNKQSQCELWSNFCGSSAWVRGMCPATCRTRDCLKILLPFNAITKTDIENETDIQNVTAGIRIALDESLTSKNILYIYQPILRKLTFDQMKHKNVVMADLFGMAANNEAEDTAAEAEDQNTILMDQLDDNRVVDDTSVRDDTQESTHPTDVINNTNDDIESIEETIEQTDDDGDAESIINKTAKNQTKNQSKKEKNKGNEQEDEKIANNNNKTTTNNSGDENDQETKAADPLTSRRCKDLHAGCINWGEFCVNNPWVQDNCPKTCHTCQQSAIEPDADNLETAQGDRSCKDQDSHCLSWIKSDPALCSTSQYISRTCLWSCGQCKHGIPKEYDVRKLPADLKSVSWLIGRWRAFAWGINNKEELHSEYGFLAVDPKSKKAGLTTVMNNGFTTVEEGKVQGSSMRLTLQDIGRISFSRDLPVHDLEREWVLLDSDTLEATLTMETLTHPMQMHTTIRYKRIFP